HGQRKPTSTTKSLRHTQNRRRLDQFNRKSARRFRVDADIEPRLCARAERDDAGLYAARLQIEGVGRACVRLDADRLTRRGRRIDDDVRELLRVELDDGLSSRVLIR